MDCVNEIGRTFDCDVVDIDAEDDASINVQGVRAGQGSFAESTIDVPQGDIASIEVILSEAALGGSGTLVIGNFGNEGYQANVTFTDGDADGMVTVLFNPSAVGYTSSNAPILDVVNSNDSENIKLTPDR